MSDLLPDSEQIEKVLNETREAIQAALTLIDNQEDGPITMRAALKDIYSRVDDIETEFAYLSSTTNYLNAIALKLLEQRDEAVRQRDMLLALLNG
jgi:hypothetical protein